MGTSNQIVSLVFFAMIARSLSDIILDDSLDINGWFSSCFYEEYESWFDHCPKYVPIDEEWRYRGMWSTCDDDQCSLTYNVTTEIPFAVQVYAFVEPVVDGDGNIRPIVQAGYLEAGGGGVFNTFRLARPGWHLIHQRFEDKLTSGAEIHIGLASKLYQQTSYIVVDKVVLLTDSIECPANGTVFLPHPKYCATYFVCVEGVPHVETCADGLLFDYCIGHCNVAEEVYCEVQENCPEEGVSLIPAAQSCTKYILCANGHGTEKECAKGTEFSRDENKCVLDSSYECPLQC